ncbi:MAG TPA: isoprenylcysteine carboxylmethyltransferase family protein [Anaerolineales bacterium]|nr:isoprenylcysteine carboxylmethyltransferase family protein [Anaerolineales bacterium]
MTEEDIDHAQVMVPPPLVFLGYLIGALVLNWLIPFPAPWTFVLRAVGGLTVIAGIVLVLSAFSQMMKAHTSPDPQQGVHALVTRGPYRWTRNPIYLGFFSIFLGFTLLDGTLWGLAGSPFLIWTVTQAVISAEEIYLEAKFGEEYRQYRSRVRPWL